MTNQEFINSLILAAQIGYQKYGILASVTIAQAINESAWGRSHLAQVDNNLFGIKYPGNHDPSLKITKGSYATDDGGYYAHYSSTGDSVEDHGYFLKNNSRYAAAIGLKDSSAQVKAIADAGYATEPDYYQITMQIINENNLIQYDSGAYTGAPSSASQLTIEATNYQVVANSQQQGDILYGRRCRITISDTEGNAFDVSKLRCTFNVIKTIQMEPNMSQITIYNLNADTENKISTIATRVTVEAGYEGHQYDSIFDGDIIQTIRGKEDNTTFILTIIALDSDRAINFNIANYSIAKGQTARTVVEHIVNKAQYPVYLGSISGSLANTPALTRGKVFFGKESDYLRQIAESNDCKYYMDNGYLNLVKIEELPSDTILDLSPSSGLIGTPEQSEYGITGKALLNPNIKLNTLIHIDNSLVREKQISFTNTTNAPNATIATTGVRAKIIEEAKKLCDDPNVGYSQQYRGQTINGITYYDCSLFTKHCYNTAGVELDDITNPQWQDVQNGGQVVDIQNAQAGDIVFWFNGNDCYHVAIYGGNSDIYAARSASKPLEEQVSYGTIYGTNYKIGRPASLIAADNGNAPSANGASTTPSTSNPVYRGLDRDGIYRVIKVTYEGDTRGESWFASFDCITQAGGQIPLVSN